MRADVLNQVEVFAGIDGAVGPERNAVIAADLAARKLIDGRGVVCRHKLDKWTAAIRCRVQTVRRIHGNAELVVVDVDGALHEGVGVLVHRRVTAEEEVLRAVDRDSFGSVSLAG